MRTLLMIACLPLMGACHASWDHDGAQNHNSHSGGPRVARTYNASGFTAVDLRGSDSVDVRVGPAFSVKAEGERSVLDELEITVVNGTLRIARKGDSSSWHWGNHDDDGARITVTLPQLSAASITGSGDMAIDRASGDFKVDNAGSGNLRIGALTGGTADIDLAGSGDVTIAGTATRLSIDIAGSGDIDARGLTATSAHISIAGSGSVRGVVKGDAEVDLLGSGDVELTGGARCRVDSMGSGEARCS